MAAKKPAAKKAPAKKTATKKAPAKKAAAKKPAAKKAPAKKTAVKKPAAKKAPAKKAAKKTTAKKTKRSSAAGRKATKKASEAPVAVEAPAAAAPVAETISLTATPSTAAVGDTGLPVQVGDSAPDFTLEADDGSTVSLSGLRGKKVVLYFYPRDNTPGCTIEARDFSQLLPEFEAKNAVVLGVSTDNLDAHRKFKNVCELSVKLLADTDKKAHDAYGVWRQKNMYGKTVWGTVRSTFLIDEEGKLTRVWPKVKVEDHALEVLNSL
jgi:peroxiredoxin Q/BCP